jgi:hypothetical protein
VFVKKVERVMATGFVMVLCLLVYRLAEQRLRLRLAETGATVPDQLKKPTQRPTLRWLFQCFEGISLVLMQRGEHLEAEQVTGLTDLHRLVLRLLGPPYEHYYALPQVDVQKMHDSPAEKGPGLDRTGHGSRLFLPWLLLRLLGPLFETLYENSSGHMEDRMMEPWSRVSPHDEWINGIEDGLQTHLV